MRTMNAVLLAAGGFVAAACRDDVSAPPVSSYTQVQKVLEDGCAACHSHLGAYLNLQNVFQITVDSAGLVESGFINPGDPQQSVLVLKPLNLIPHGGRRIESFDAERERIVRDWIRQQPNLYAYTLTAGRIDAASAPLIDGNPSDAAWAGMIPIRMPIDGGWADAREVTMAAAYDGEYAYFILQWADDQPSERRQPWIKQSDGTWRTTAAKPRPLDGYTWGRNAYAEGPQYLYEDKVALMWNTYGASTVAGFDNAGCAVTCHDPRNNYGPGKTYFYGDENRAAKKYTNSPNEIADLWHWKFVRMNQHFKIDDQVVQYWQPYTGDPLNGGRGSDEGTGGYASNPATSGRPTYRNPTSLTAPPFYILSTEKVAATPEELAALPAGSMLPNMITAGPTGSRADVDGHGVYDPATRTWTLEIRRKMVTADPKDVQFDDLVRAYVFGVAIFDNAQIEHSYSSTPLRLVFRP